MKKQKPCESKACAKKEKPCKPKGSAPKRISSGVPGFDKLVQGGFKDKSINLVVGGPGSGKTIFTIMFLIEGFKKGEPGIYITFEEKKEKLYEDMLSFGWDLEAYEKKGLFNYLEYTPEQVKRLLIEGGGTVDSIVTKMKAQRLVIDSVTSFSLLYREELAKKEAALALFEIIDKWNCTALLTSQEIGMEGIEVSAALQFEVDSITILYHEKRKGERMRALEVLKMRGTKIPNETYAIKINGCGFEVLPQKVDF
ncbi:MAG: ATPase domain-containing protein [Nanoarchaeota archaeon]